MSEPTKKCARTDCGADLAGVERWDCTCGCGKSWCGKHGWHRKRAEMPGDKSYLVRVLPSAPLIPQSRAEEMVAEEREEIAKVAEAFLFSESKDSREDLDRLAAFSNGTVRRIVAAIRARKTEAPAPSPERQKKETGR
jgi:hypothetical protein